MNQKKNSFLHLDFSHIELMAAELDIEIGRVEEFRFIFSSGVHTGRILGKNANFVVRDDYDNKAKHTLPEPVFFTPKIPDKSARALHAPKPRKRW